MKCPICDGMGTSNTCVNGTFKPCSFCDGTGECDANEVNRFNAVDFIKVMEMVKKPQTNEEWLNSLVLDTKAYWLANTCRKAMWENKYDNNDEKSTLGYWVEWLKEKHNEM